MRIDRRAVTVTSLGLTQTLAWASSYYLPAMLASSMARDLNISVQSVFAFFSSALVLAALLGPLAGRCIDRYGGRPVLLRSEEHTSELQSLMRISYAVFCLKKKKIKTKQK